MTHSESQNRSQTVVQDYGLNFHAQAILQEYREKLPIYQELERVVQGVLQRIADEGNLYVTATEVRVKTEVSLVGKLELKGGKYGSLMDITDIFGARVITFYDEDVDKFASLAEQYFEIDCNNSVDKRKRYDKYSFGYLSLHYVCKVPKSIYFDVRYPEINEIRFELQMRTALQHVWATIEHDTGYKKGVEIPGEYLRTLGQLAGMLEMADAQFSRIRKAVTDYRRSVLAAFKDGNFDDVPLDSDTFPQYMALKPFDTLLDRIARTNQAEIYVSSALPYLDVLRHFGFKTIGDIVRLRKDCEEDAYKLALSQIGGTDLDILDSTIALQYLIAVWLMKNGHGPQGIDEMLRMVNPSLSNSDWAQQLCDAARRLLLP